MSHWYDQIKPKFVANVANMYLAENNFRVFDIFPKVNSRQISGYIATYTKADWLKIGTVDDYKRAGAAESAGDDFATGSTAYVLDEYAFHKDISKDDRAEYDNPFDPVRDAVAFVMNRLDRVLLYNLVSDMLTTGVWGTDVDVTGSEWNTKTSGVSDNDPVEAVATWHQDIEKVTGYRANRMIITADVFWALKGNTTILDKMKTTNDKVVTTGLLAKLFEVEDLYVLNAVNSGGTDYMATSKALLYYAPRVASKFAPSAAYHITYKGQNGNILTQRIPMREKNDALRIEAEVKTTPKVVGSDLAVYAHDMI